MPLFKQYQLDDTPTQPTSDGSSHTQASLSQPLNPVGQDFVSSPNVFRLDKTLNIKDRIILNDKELVNKIGQTFGRTAFSTLVSGSVYTVSTSDYLIGITSLSYAPFVGLPRPRDVGPGKAYIIKDEVGGAATTTITIQSDGYETIDGASTSTITTNYGTRDLYTDGANWFTK